MKAKVHRLSHEQLLQRIWIDPARCVRKLCITRHRIWVSLIFDLLASVLNEESRRRCAKSED